jgi:excisionase family DNA binding protein
MLPMSPTTPHMLTIQQTADMLGVHYYTARKWVAEGKLPSVSFGKKSRRVQLAALSRLIKQMTTGGY